MRRVQDWNYLAADRLELTLELSTQKSPPASQLPSLFRNNLRSMLGFARTAALGGCVEDMGRGGLSQGANRGQRRWVVQQGARMHTMKRTGRIRAVCWLRVMLSWSRVGQDGVQRNGDQPCKPRGNILPA